MTSLFAVTNLVVEGKLGHAITFPLFIALNGLVTCTLLDLLLMGMRLIGR